MTDGLGPAQRILGSLIAARTGQQLPQSRAWRFEAALAPLMRQLGCADLDGLAAAIATGDDRLATQVVEALLNNETSFFRDRDTWTQLETRLLPMLFERRRAQRRLDIWSAGCSTGQEVYSLAMLLADLAPRHWSICLAGTDVSGTAIARAKEGRYSRFEIQRGLPMRAMLRWFEEQRDEWVASTTLRGSVRFAQASLFDRPVGRFDLILCRNVLMYFSPANRRTVFDRLAEALPADGLLMLGAGETVLGQTDRFTPHPELRGVYLRTDAMRRAA